MAYLHHHPYIIQAWAFASGTRMVLGKVPLMNMESFPYDIWTLHRKLFHRFMKYRKYFLKASNAPPELKKLKKLAPVPKKDAEPVVSPPTNTPAPHVINLLSSSEGEVSDDSDDTAAEVDEFFNSDGDSDDDPDGDTTPEETDV